MIIIVMSLSSLDRSGNYRGEIFLAVVLFGLLLAGAHSVSALYEKGGFRANDGPQPHYELQASKWKSENHAVSYWVEFGKNSKLISEKVSGRDFQVRLSGFQTDVPWSRDIHWYAQTPKVGRISVSFPPGEAESVLLFFGDGDSYERSSVITSGDYTTVAFDLHDGKWLDFPLSEKEKTQGRKSFRIRRLTGPNAALSALVVLKREAGA